MSIPLIYHIREILFSHEIHTYQVMLHVRTHTHMHTCTHPHTPVGTAHTVAKINPWQETQRGGKWMKQEL